MKISALQHTEDIWNGSFKKCINRFQGASRLLSQMNCITIRVRQACQRRGKYEASCHLQGIVICREPLYMHGIRSILRNNWSRRAANEGSDDNDIGAGF